MFNKLIKNFIENKINVLAIPTTAGAGAEVTSNAVIYLNKIKIRLVLVSQLRVIQVGV